MILCDTRSAADPPEVAQMRHETADQVLDQGTDSLADGMLGKLFSPHSREHQPELLEFTREMIRSCSPVGVASALRGMAARPDSTEILPEIDVPALVICGTHDVISPVEEMKGIAEKMPRAQFVEIADAGHMTPLENAAAFHRAVRSFRNEL